MIAICLEYLPISLAALLLARRLWIHMRSPPPAWTSLDVYKHHAYHECHANEVESRRCPFAVDLPIATARYVRAP